MERQPAVERVRKNDGSSQNYRDGDGLLVLGLRRGAKHGSDNDGAAHRRNS